MPREIPLIHPGEILLEDWLKPMGISQYALAKAIGGGAPTDERAAAMIRYLRNLVLAPPLQHERGHAIFLDARSNWLGDAPCGIGTLSSPKTSFTD